VCVPAPRDQGAPTDFGCKVTNQVTTYWDFLTDRARPEFISLRAYQLAISQAWMSVNWGSMTSGPCVAHDALLMISNPDESAHACSSSLVAAAALATPGH